ncbi:uncharacterized protein LOC129289620 [Prosopis cineraria]|uniref:uncharacterized protein LOC129289620 n=1 Tax=Prosopis cineraria TaxID=364024 RepID=UPI00241002D8|nr:uncharacterized protein LOC129289620 [Prosopis cineraria]
MTQYTYKGDCLEEMANTIERELEDCPEMLEMLKSDAEKPLYVGCTEFTKLSVVLKLYNLKVSNGWSDKSFTENLTLIKQLLPANNELLRTIYEVKQMLRSIGMSYEKIHACLNDCILFRNKYASLMECPKCNALHYKENGKSPKKALWYFSIVPRFRRLYSSAEDAKNLTWQADERIKDGKLRHPADSSQWKKIDLDYLDFGAENRNLRLILSTNRMNPHGLQSSSHSTWPVILVIYNLPLWLCMKRKYMMLSILILGPKQPGNDIDIYLAPLIEDLKLLWEHGVEVYDGHREERFNLRALLFGTMNDFPAYGNLSGYSIKGKLECPICEDSTHLVRLEHGMKNVYLGHRRWLHPDHYYRHLEKAFNGNSEESKAPLPLIGEQHFDKVKNLNIKFGKPFAKHFKTCGWKKRFVFFDLPYWQSLYVRHFLDTIHIEKNVCDSLIGTLLHILRKTKDDIKARLDMISTGIGEELVPQEKGSRTFLHAAAHSLFRREKKIFCELLATVKVPEGYSSNIKGLVSLKDLKLKGLKLHNCHVLMENFIPVAIRSILPDMVRAMIIKLCFFFKSICSKVIDPTKLSRLQSRIVLILCELEMYFSPAFFDIMVHLTIHLVREIQMCGPVFLRWMYPFERYMKILKGYVKNRSQPKGCIVERYIL